MVGLTTIKCSTSYFYGALFSSSDLQPKVGFIPTSSGGGIGDIGVGGFLRYFSMIELSGSGAARI